MHAVVECEWSDDALVAVSRAVPTAGDLVAAAHQQLALPLPVGAYVLWLRGRALPTDEPLAEAGLACGGHVTLELTAAAAGEQMLLRRGVTPENVRERVAEAVNKDDADALAAMVRAQGYAAEAICETLHACALDATRLSFMLDTGAAQDTLDMPFLHNGTEQTLLARAAGAGAVDSVEVLVRHGADVKGSVALVHAAKNGHAEVAACLARHGADPNAVVHRRGTALAYAVARGHAGVVEGLLAHGGDPNAPAASSGVTGVMVAAFHGRVGILAQLVAQGGDPTQADAAGEDALSQAIGQNQVMAAAWLLDPRVEAFCFDVNRVLNGRHGMRYLHTAVAAQRHSVEMLRLLLARGCDVNGRDAAGCTAAMYAVRHAWCDGLEALLEAGADIHLRDDVGQGCVTSAAVHNTLGILVRLLDAGAAKEERDRAGRTPLIHAAGKGFEEVARFLIERGAAVEARDDEGWTPLLHACARGRVEMAHRLLDVGADVHVVDAAGRSCLHVAQPEVTMALLGRGGVDICHQ